MSLAGRSDRVVQAGRLGPVQPAAQVSVNRAHTTGFKHGLTTHRRADRARIALIAGEALPARLSNGASWSLAARGAAGTSVAVSALRLVDW